MKRLFGSQGLGGVLARPLAVLVLGAGMGSVAFAQTVIPPSFAAPDGTIDSGASGFLVHVHQLESGVQRDPRHDLATVELQLAGSLIDPDGVPYANEADLTDASYEKNEGGSFVVEGVINFSDVTDPFLGTTGSSGNFTPDDKYPGIPGFGNGVDFSDDFAVEILSFIELKAGLNRLGINSDDGFRFTIGVGTNTRDAFAEVPDGASFEGSRGAANSEWDLNVEADGLYPIRIVHWDGGGEGSIEFYSVFPPEAGGERILVNDTSNANAVRSFRTATGTTPTATSVLPRPGSSGVFPRPTISVELQDGEASIDQGSVRLAFGGADVTGETSVSKTGGTTVIQYLTPEFLTPNSLQNATLGFSDSNGVARSHTWSFTIADFVNLTGDLAYPLDAKDTAATGFSVRVHQAREGAGLPASVARANAQIRGSLVDPFSGDIFTNEASESDAVVEGVINFVESTSDDEQPEKGNFTGTDSGETLFPGIPGSGGA